MAQTNQATAKIRQLNQPGWTSYLSSAQEHFKGTQYENLMNSNPYNDYKGGLWDALGNALGFQTNEDEYQRASQEYIAQLYQMEHEEQYNSAAAQAQRERAAGINPDLAGNVSPGDAMEFDQGVTPPAPMSPGASILPGILGAFDGALGLYSKIQGVKSQIIGNDEREFSMAGGIENFIGDIVAGFYGDDGKNPSYNRKDGVFSYQSGDDENNIILKKLPFNKRNNRRALSYLGRIINSPSGRAMFYERANRSLSGRRDYAREIFRPDSAAEDEPAEVMRDVLAPVIKDLFDKEKYEAQGGMNKALADDNYQAGRNVLDSDGNPVEFKRGAADTITGLEQSKEAGEKAKSQTSAASVTRKIINKLAAKAQEGSDFAAAMLIAYSVLSNMNYAPKM